MAEYVVTATASPEKDTPGTALSRGDKQIFPQRTLKP